MIVQCHSKFVEKTISDSFGRQYRAVFIVTFEGEKVKGRLISITLLNDFTGSAFREEVRAISGFQSDCGLYLPISSNNKLVITPYVSLFRPIVSPYFSKLDIFLSTQLTRAPAFV